MFLTTNCSDGFSFTVSDSSTVDALNPHTARIKRNPLNVRRCNLELPYKLSVNIRPILRRGCSCTVACHFRVKKRAIPDPWKACTAVCAHRCRTSTLPCLQRSTMRGTHTQLSSPITIHHTHTHKQTSQAVRVLKRTAEWPAEPLRSYPSRLKIIRRVLGAKALASET